MIQQVNQFAELQSTSRIRHTEKDKVNFMKIIALDTSGPVAGCAILDGDKLLAEYTVNYKRKHSETLLPMLDAISKMTELNLETVDAIAVAAGPGSFTGLRIGSATAKGIGLALNKPIIEVPTLAGLAYNVFGARGLICPIMDARRMQVYNGIYRFDGDRLVTLCDQRALAIEDLLAELSSDKYPPAADEPIVFLGDGVPISREKIDQILTRPHIYAPANASLQRAASIGALGLVFLAEGKNVVPAADHVPIYLRKSQAEREREKTGMLHGDAPKKDNRQKLSAT